MSQNWARHAADCACGGCSLKVVAIKAPGFGERKTSYLEDIAILTGAQVVRDEVGLSVDKVSWRHLYCLYVVAGR